MHIHLDARPRARELIAHTFSSADSHKKCFPTRFELSANSLTNLEGRNMLTGVNFRII